MYMTDRSFVWKALLNQRPKPHDCKNRKIRGFQCGFCRFRCRFCGFCGFKIRNLWFRNLKSAKSMGFAKNLHFSLRFQQGNIYGQTKDQFSRKVTPIFQTLKGEKISINYLGNIRRTVKYCEIKVFEVKKMYSTSKK